MVWRNAYVQESVYERPDFIFGAKVGRNMMNKTRWAFNVTGETADSSLFAYGPVVNTTGHLRFTLAQGASGIGTFNITMTDGVGLVTSSQFRVMIFRSYVQLGLQVNPDAEYLSNGQINQTAMILNLSSTFGISPLQVRIVVSGASRRLLTAGNMQVTVQLLGFSNVQSLLAQIGGQNALASIFGVTVDNVLLVERDDAQAAGFEVTKKVLVEEGSGNHSIQSFISNVSFGRLTFSDVNGLKVITFSVAQINSTAPGLFTTDPRITAACDPLCTSNITFEVTPGLFGISFFKATMLEANVSQIFYIVVRRTTPYPFNISKPSLELWENSLPYSKEGFCGFPIVPNVDRDLRFTVTVSTPQIEASQLSYPAESVSGASPPWGPAEVVTNVSSAEASNQTFRLPNLGFDFWIGDTNYRESVYVSSGSWIAFGSRDAALEGNEGMSLTGVPVLFIGGGNSTGILSQLIMGKPVSENNTRGYAVRFEGTQTAGASAPSVVWEATFFSNGNIRISVGAHSAADAGLFYMTNGVKKYRDYGPSLLNGGAELTLPYSPPQQAGTLQNFSLVLAANDFVAPPYPGESLFADPPRVDGEGKLSLTLAKDQFGFVILNITMYDKAAPEREDLFLFQQYLTVELSVLSVNQQPTFNIPHTTVRVFENCATDIFGNCTNNTNFTLYNFSRQIWPGSWHELWQTYTFTVTPVRCRVPVRAGGSWKSADTLYDSGCPPDLMPPSESYGPVPQNEKLFAAPVAVDDQGTLTFSLAQDKHGIVDFSLVLSDDGGTLRGGYAVSSQATFTVDVVRVNKPPTVTLTQRNFTVNDGCTGYYPEQLNVNGWVWTNISASCDHGTSAGCWKQLWSCDYAVQARRLLSTTQPLFEGCVNGTCSAMVVGEIVLLGVNDTSALIEVKEALVTAIRNHFTFDSHTVTVDIRQSDSFTGSSYARETSRSLLQISAGAKGMRVIFNATISGVIDANFTVLQSRTTPEALLSSLQKLAFLQESKSAVSVLSIGLYPPGSLEVILGCVEPPLPPRVQCQNGVFRIDDLVTNISTGGWGEEDQDVFFEIRHSSGPKVGEPWILFPLTNSRELAYFEFVPSVGILGTAVYDVIVRDSGGTKNGGVDQTVYAGALEVRQTDTYIMRAHTRTHIHHGCTIC
jgi:hypothetical protein